MRSRLPHMLSVTALLAMAIGCARGVTPGADGIELLPPTGVGGDLRALRCEFPTGMTVTREITVRSRLRTVLRNIKVVASCGCTSASLDRDDLSPGDSATLRCTFDGSKANGERDINVMLFSPDSPAGPFELGMQFVTDAGRSQMAIASTPHGITHDAVWEKHLALKTRLKLNFGAEVPVGSLTTAASTPLLRVRRDGDMLSVVLDSPPVGAIEEQAMVSFRRGSDVYTLAIPVTGRIRPPVAVAPKALTFDGVPASDDMQGTLRLVASARAGVPKVSVTGDWKAAPLQNAGDHAWTIRVSLNGRGQGATRYGTVVVSGEWPGEPIRIPISGTFRPAVPTPSHVTQ